MNDRNAVHNGIWQLLRGVIDVGGYLNQRIVVGDAGPGTEGGLHKARSTRACAARAA